MDTSTSPIPLIATITAIVARESASSSTEIERVRILQAISDLPGMDAGDALERRYFEYDIEVQSQPAVDQEVRILASIRSLALAAAPEVAAVIPFGTGSVIVRRYAACAGERLVPAELTDGRFDVAARERFRQDMAALAASGRVHTYARGLAHWFVSDRTHAIVLNRWVACEPTDPEECARFVKSIDRQLASRS